MTPRPLSAEYAALALLSLASCQLAPAPEGARRQKAEAVALRVERGVIAQRLLLTGELEAVSAESLSVPRTPRWNIAVRWLAENGSSVSAGDPVVELDNSAFVGDLADRKLALEQALADRDQQAARDDRATADKEFEVAKAEIVLEKATLEAAVPIDALARRTHQERQLALERARVGLEAARDALGTQVAAAALERTLRQIAIDKAEREIRASEQATLAVVLRAPRAGTVFIGDHPGWGRRLEVGDHVWPGLAVARLPDLSELRVNAVLADVDDGRVLEGMAVTTLLDAYPEQRFAGVVSEISPVAQELFPAARRRFFRVRIQLERTDPALMRPGMSVRVEVPKAGAEPALLAPRASLWLERTPVELQLASGALAPVTLLACERERCAFEPESTGAVTEGTPLGRVQRGDS